MNSAKAAAPRAERLQQGQHVNPRFQLRSTLQAAALALFLLLVARGRASWVMLICQ